MGLLVHLLGCSPISSWLARVAGIPHTRVQDFRAALHTPRALSVLLLLIALRARRGVRKYVTKSLYRDGPGSTASESSNCVTTPPREGKTGCTKRDLVLPPGISRETFPRLIFQTWKSKYLLPNNFAYWSATLKKMNPDFAYLLWDDQDNRRFIEQNYPWFLPFYDIYPREIYRADAVRYFFLYQYGGLYADMDTECLRPLTHLFDSADIWLGMMGQDVDFPHSIPNAIMASRPRQEFWLLVIYLMMQKVESVKDPAAMASQGPESLTGPVILKEALNIYRGSDRVMATKMIASVATHLPADLQPFSVPSRVFIFDRRQWYPIDWTNVLHDHLITEVTDFHVMLQARTTRWVFPEAYLVTYWTHTWKPSTERQ